MIKIFSSTTSICLEADNVVKYVARIQTAMNNNYTFINKLRNTAQHLD